MNPKDIRPAFKAFLTILLLTLTACGSSLQNHSHVGEFLDDASMQGRAAALDLREDALREAAERAEAEGRAIEAAVRSAAYDFDEGPVIDAVNAFISAKNAYIRGVLLRAQERRPSFVGMLPLANDALRAYGALRDALGPHGSRLPEVPAFLTQFAGGES